MLPSLPNSFNEKLRYHLIFSRDTIPQKARSIWLDKRHNTWSYLAKNGSLRCWLPFTITYMYKKLSINWFFTEILSNKKSYNLIWQEAHLAISIKSVFFKRWSIDFCQRYWWSKNLQSDWTRGKPRQTQPKTIESDATLYWWVTPSKKAKISIDSFQKYWWTKNLAIWLDKGYNLPHPIKRGGLRCYLLRISMPKI